METVHVSVASLQELEDAIRDHASAPHVVVDVDVTNMFEAEAMRRRLTGLLGRGSGWEVAENTMEMLKAAVDHYIELDLLATFAELVELDLRDGIPLKKARFDCVRRTANDVVTTAHPTSTLDVLRIITLEAQMIGRVARGLGFGSEDVEVYQITEDEMMWFQEDGDAGGDDDRKGEHQLGTDEGEPQVNNGDEKQVQKTKLLSKIGKLKDVIASTKTGPFIQHKQ